MWRSRSLAGLIAAELVSLTGSAMTFVALPWFVLVTTGSTARMGWVLAAEMLPEVAGEDERAVAEVSALLSAASGATQIAGPPCARRRRSGRR